MTVKWTTAPGAAALTPGVCAMVSAETGIDTVQRASVLPAGQLVPVVAEVTVKASVPLPA